MTSPDQLQDPQLLSRCCYWRRQAIRGHSTARTIAHTYEAELKRRLSDETTMCGTLDRSPLQRRAFWRFW